MRNSLRALEGVSQVEVDIDEKVAVVVASATVKTDELIAVTTKIGFPSSLKHSQRH